MDKKYLQFITDLKQNILQSRYIAARLVNKEQLLLYFRTGKMLSDKINAEKWGAKIIEQISLDLQKQIPGLRGFSYRNLKKMRQFFEEYSNNTIGPLATAQLSEKSTAPFLPLSTAELRNLRKEEQIEIDQLNTPEFNSHFFSIPFTHHILLLNKCKDLQERFFYIEQAATQFWSVTLLEHHINAGLYSSLGKLPNNFTKTLSERLTPTALKVFQDEYLVDFISSADIEDERVFEDKVVADIKNFIMRMGKGFSFIGNQYRLEVGGEEFFIDLLFFNRCLQCLVVFELKRGKFKPEYAGQLNFYLNVLDEKIKLPNENPSIGLILCKEKNNTVVEFAVKTIDKAMGVATYRTTKETPKEMKGIFPDTKDLVRLL